MNVALVCIGLLFLFSAAMIAAEWRSARDVDESVVLDAFLAGVCVACAFAMFYLAWS